MFEPIPDNLSDGPVRLTSPIVSTPKGHPEFVPMCRFRVMNDDGDRVGQVNLRVGDTPHIRLYAGHIGYDTLEPFRGRGYAGHACRALAPFARRFYENVVITAEVDNRSSRRVLEKLGAELVEEREVPPSDPSYANGARRKAVYVWNLSEVVSA